MSPCPQPLSPWWPLSSIHSLCLKSSTHQALRQATALSTQEMLKWACILGNVK